MQKIINNGNAFDKSYQKVTGFNGWDNYLYFSCQNGINDLVLNILTTVYCINLEFYNYI
jgi:hypothetical protein